MNHQFKQTLFQRRAALTVVFSSQLKFALLVIMAVLLSACAAKHGILPARAGEPETEQVYSCTEIRVDAVIADHLKHNDRAFGLHARTASLQPHLKFVATEIAKATQGKMFSTGHCRIASNQVLYAEKWFSRVEHSVHYIVDLKMQNGNRVSEICVTRNRYAIDSGVTKQDLEKWEKERRQALSSGLLVSGPMSIRECFRAGALT